MTPIGSDRLLQQGLQLWNQTLGEFTERVEQVVRRRPPQVRAELLYDRRQLFDAMVRQATCQLDTYDLREEARRILENARCASFATGSNNSAPNS